MLRRLSTMLTSYHLYLDGLSALSALSAIPQHATARFFCDLPLLTSVEQGGYMIALYKTLKPKRNRGNLHMNY